MEDILSILTNNLSITKDDISKYIRDNINDICIERLNKFKEEVDDHTSSIRLQMLEAENKELKLALKQMEQEAKSNEQSNTSNNKEEKFSSDTIENFEISIKSKVSL